MYIMTGVRSLKERQRKEVRLLVSKLLILQGGSSSVVERQLPKLNVAGSIPVSRSNLSNSGAASESPPP